MSANDPQPIVERGVPREPMRFLDEKRDDAALKLGPTLAFFEKHLTAKQRFAGIVAGKRYASRNGGDRELR